MTKRLFPVLLFLFSSVWLFCQSAPLLPEEAATAQSGADADSAVLIKTADNPRKEMRYRSGLDIMLSESAVISMVTVYPGDEVYSLFGHSSFRVNDPENMIDWMYNYGSFDFSDPFFVPKFTSGRLDYYLDINNFPRSLRFYADVEKRRVFEQVLSLDTAQKQALFDFLQENGETENRFYRYDFIYDNCSTRIALALEKAFPGMTDYSSYTSEGKSFRQMIREYLSGYPFLDFGIQLVLGYRADREPEGNEVFFLPVPMMEAFSSASFGPSGTPLVSDERELAPSGREYPVKADYPFFVFLAILLLYCASFLLVSGRRMISDILRPGTWGLKIYRVKLSAALLIIPAAEFFVLFFTGISGIVISYLWFLSDHTIAADNFNILWCSPVNLVLAAAVIREHLPRPGGGSGSRFGQGRPVMRFLWIITASFQVIYLALAFSGVQAALPAFLPPVAVMLAAAGRRTALPVRKLFDGKS